MITLVFGTCQSLNKEWYQSFHLLTVISEIYTFQKNKNYEEKIRKCSFPKLSSHQWQNIMHVYINIIEINLKFGMYLQISKKCLSMFVIF